MKQQLLKQFSFVYFLCVFLHSTSFLKIDSVFAKPKKDSKDSKDSEMLATARYMQNVHNQVQRKWKPKGLSLMELHHRSATLTLWISPKGELLKTIFVRTSGLKAFDQLLHKAIVGSSPFAHPPLSFQQTVSKLGIDIVFRKRVFKKKLLPIHRQYKGSAKLPIEGYKSSDSLAKKHKQSS